VTLRVGVAGIPGTWSTEHLRRALEQCGCDTLVFSAADCVVEMRSGAVRHAGVDLGELDAVVVKKLGSTTDPMAPSRVHLLIQLEARGVRVFSPAAAIAEVQDRYRMTGRLSHAGIPLPATIVTESVAEAAAAIRRWGRAVVKPLFTSKGSGMLMLAGGAPLRLALRRWQRQWRMPFYVQEYVPHAGRDIGVVVLAREVLGAYYRVARRDAWLTTTAAGGHYEACPVTPVMRELAVRAADVFGLTFTCVDLVEGPHGYLAYEVSAFGSFGGLWRTQGIDAAQRYAEHVVHTLRERTPDERTGIDHPRVPA